MVKRYGLLVWGAFAIAALLSLVAIGLMFVPLPGQPLDPANIVDEILTAGGGVMDALVGAVIATRLQKNPIGWIFITAGLGLAMGMDLSNYAQIAFWSGTETLSGGLGGTCAAG